MWKSVLDIFTCLNCRENHGKIYSINEDVFPEPPLHPNCRCIIQKLKVINSGTATKKGVNGADKEK